MFLPHSRIMMNHGKDFRLMHQAAFQPIEQWSRIRHPNIVAVHEAFTTRSFGDHCLSLALFSSLFLNLLSALVVAYTYHPTAQTLYDAHMKPRPPAFVHGRVQPAQPYVPERTVWSYIIQIAGAMKVAHDQGLAVRMIDVTKVIVTGRNRLRISSCGLADVLTYNPTSPTRLPGVPIPTEQIQEDLVMFGKLIMALCCNNVAAMSNFGKSLEVVTQHYSADLKNVALFCLSKPGVHKVMPHSRVRLSRATGMLTCGLCVLNEAHRTIV
jgi:PAB-dependent poly(A)-specific ribonuclease subunit 3